MDPLFRSTLLELTLNPWYALKQRLDDEHGLQFAVSYTSLYQTASRTFTGKDEGASGVLEIGGAWTG